MNVFLERPTDEELIGTYGEWAWEQWRFWCLLREARTWKDENKAEHVTYSIPWEKALLAFLARHPATLDEDGERWRILMTLNLITNLMNEGWTL